MMKLNEPLVRVRGVSKRYGSQAVLTDIHLDIYPGETVAIIGPNGAGKSTLLDLLLGLRQPDTGTIEHISGDPRAEIGLQLQSVPYFAGFTALENMRMLAACYGLRCRDAELLALLERCGLGEAARRDAARLSGGQQKRLALAMATVHRPRLLFLDEPAAALDPRARRDIRALIRELAGDGASIVLTSHDMEEVGLLADRVILLHAGRIVAEGTPEALLAAWGADSLEELFLRCTETLPTQEREEAGVC